MSENDMKKQGVIFNIQRFSLHDGPGIRTLIFLKGCSLRCQWCSNPEGISADVQIRYRKKDCIGCGKCMVCSHKAISFTKEKGFFIDRKKCVMCGECVRVCTPKAKFYSGEIKDLEGIISIIERDRAFYAEMGGVTLSGGEACLQPEFCLEILKKCRESDIGTAIETAGNYPYENIRCLLPYLDTVFFDVKGWNEKRHMECTGASNKRILENLVKLDADIADMKKGPVLIIRIPILTGYNILPEDMEAIAEFSAGLKSLSGIEILPFHNLGEDKYNQLDMDYKFFGHGNLRTDDVREYEEILAVRDLPHRVVTW